MTEQERQYFIAQKYFLALADMLARYKAGGKNPPEYLLKNIKDAKCEMNNIAEALE